MFAKSSTIERLVSYLTIYRITHSSSTNDFITMGKYHPDFGMLYICQFSCMLVHHIILRMIVRLNVYLYQVTIRNCFRCLQKLLTRHRKVEADSRATTCRKFCGRLTRINRILREYYFLVYVIKFINLLS